MTQLTESEHRKTSMEQPHSKLITEVLAASQLSNIRMMIMTSP